MWPRREGERLGATECGVSIFKACDIRGVVGEELDAGLTERIGRAVATLRGGGPVVVGGDARRSTPDLRAALIAGLRASGADVVDVGMLPTPAFYFTLRRLAVRGAVMVTASHNPPQYNGFKVVLGDLPVEPADVQRLAALVESGAFTSGGGTLSTEEGAGPYVEWLVRTGPSVAGLRVVVDAAGGCMSEVAPAVLGRLGAEVHCVHCTVDPDLRGRNPNPVIPGALADLEAEVVARGADLGVGFDADGDRVVFVDEAGRTVAQEHAATLLLREVLREDGPAPAAVGAPSVAPGASGAVNRAPTPVPVFRGCSAHGTKVIRDIKFSALLDEEVRAAGGVALIERSGHAFIRRRMVTERAVFGCEVSGHYFYGRLGGDDDSLLSALILGRYLLGQRPRHLHELVAALPLPRISPDIRLPARLEEAPELLARVEAALEDAEVSHLDGVRAQWPDGWGLVRASVTEPVITLRFEALGEMELPAIAARFLRGAPELLQPVLRAMGASAGRP